MADQRVEPEAIAVDPKPGDDPDRNPGNVGIVSELFSGMDV
jgi:hypothetical protein